MYGDSSKRSRHQKPTRKCRFPLRPLTLPLKGSRGEAVYVSLGSLDWRVCYGCPCRIGVRTRWFYEIRCMVIAPKGRDTKNRLENVASPSAPLHCPLRGRE